MPTLQHLRALVSYVHAQLGLPSASTAPLAAVSARFEKAIHAFAAAQDIPVVHLVKGQRKDDVAHQYLEAFLAAGRREGVLFIGRAQEKTPVLRTEKRRRADGSTYPWIVKTTAMVNHWYFYGYDDDFGPFLLKFAGYFPSAAGRPDRPRSEPRSPSSRVSDAERRPLQAINHAHRAVHVPGQPDGRRGEFRAAERARQRDRAVMHRHGHGPGVLQEDVGDDGAHVCRNVVIRAQEHAQQVMAADDAEQLP